MATEGTYQSHVKEYMIIFFALGILTIVEVIIPELKLSYLWHAGGLTFLALVKAFLVGYYYMHLKEEQPWLKFIALIPISAFIFATVICLETAGR